MSDITDTFYADKNFLNTKYSMDIALESHITGLILKDEMDRIIHASNDYAMRKRARLESYNNLNLPFVNYKMDDFEFGATPWWNQELFTSGIFLPELGIKVRMSPVSLQYESTYWAHRSDELLYAFSELRFDADSKTTITAYIDVNDVEVPFSGQLSYTNLDFDPRYTEMDWLERNKIHSISLDFEVITWIMKTNADITIPKKVIHTFQSLHGIEDTVSYEETMEAIVNHFSEEVEDFEAPS
jgi:hypothetical protein